MFLSFGTLFRNANCWIKNVKVSRGCLLPYGCYQGLNLGMTDCFTGKLEPTDTDIHTNHAAVEILEAPMCCCRRLTMHRKEVSLKAKKSVNILENS